MIRLYRGGGIVVRNSIILVDFIDLKLAEGIPLEKLLSKLAIVRFRPCLEAAAVVVGVLGHTFRSYLQVMAISLMSGEVAATFLSRTCPVPIFS